MERLSIAAHTLGCKVNQCDTDALLDQIKALGFVIRNFSNSSSNSNEANEAADVYIINTCTVTHVSDKKSRQMIRRARKMNPNAFVAVCGCMPQGNAEALASVKDAGADYVFDARKPEDFLERLRGLANVNGYSGLDEVLALPRSRTRAFIKIQDGCNRFCSYCIVPYVRGGLKSRPVADIMAEAEKLIRQGVVEIVLTGIQAASYGEDRLDDDCNFVVLVKDLSSLKGLERLRLSSLDPWAVTEKFLDMVGSSAVLCDHFHLSLQSGCDATLSRMNRRYTTSEYARAASGLRNLRPGAALTTDIIVGFPGETDADFAESLSFVQEIGFAQVHVFEYSRREGTPAASFPGQVSDAVKTARGKEMRKLAAELHQKFLQTQVGKTVPVLFEKYSAGKCTGHSSNYCLVEADSEINPVNSIKQVEIIACANGVLTGYIK